MLSKQTLTQKKFQFFMLRAGRDILTTGKGNDPDGTKTKITGSTQNLLTKEYAIELLISVLNLADSLFSLLPPE